MRRFSFGLILALLLAAVSLTAAGTVTVTRATIVGGGVRRITLAWTSTAGGAVSGNAFAVPAGELLQVKFVPAAGGTQPSDLYDVTLVDQDSVDVLAGLGANLSNAAAAIKTPLIGSSTVQRIYVDGTQTLDLVVANAGSAKTGTVVLWIR